MNITLNETITTKSRLREFINELNKLLSSQSNESNDDLLQIISVISINDFNNYITKAYLLNGKNIFNGNVSTTSKFNTGAYVNFNTDTVQNNTNKTHSEECYVNGHVYDPQYMIWQYDGIRVGYIGYTGHNKTDTYKKVDASVDYNTYVRSNYSFRPCIRYNEK